MPWQGGLQTVNNVKWRSEAESEQSRALTEDGVAIAKPVRICRTHIKRAV